MHLLLIHQNFPAQFRDLAPAWLAAGHRVTAIGCRPLPPQGAQWRGLRYCSYQPSDGSDPTGLTPRERADAIDQLCAKLISEGLHADLVMVHSAWGEALPLRRRFPTTPLLVYPELWGSPAALGLGFDDHLSVPLPHDALRDLHQRIERQNLLAELAIHAADAVIVPSRSQWGSFPAPLQAKLELIFEGMALEPTPNEAELPDPWAHLPPEAPLLSLVSRGLEPLRGLRQVLQAWPEVARRHPLAQLVLVGDVDPSSGYGEERPHLATHLDDALAALPADVDRNRIHTPGVIGHKSLLALLRRTSCHLGLSYPYTLSWSLVEAMACGAPVISNFGGPLAAEVEQGVQALLVPFNDPPALAEAMLELLGSAEQRRCLGEAAQQLVAERFSLKRALDDYGRLFDRLGATQPEPARAQARAATSLHGSAGATGAGSDTRH